MLSLLKFCNKINELSLFDVIYNTTTNIKPSLSTYLISFPSFTLESKYTF